ncbi:Uncharacterised protein [uncultured archaeon]|nr:Uncharacterised protein [uncultured archaeon]
MSMETFIKSENCESNERRRKPDHTERLKRDLRRWQRKRATIEKYKEEKFGVPETGRGVELSVHNLKKRLALD